MRVELSQLFGLFQLFRHRAKVSAWLGNVYWTKGPVVKARWLLSPAETVAVGGGGRCAATESAVANAVAVSASPPAEAPTGGVQRPLASCLRPFNGAITAMAATFTAVPLFDWK